MNELRKIQRKENNSTANDSAAGNDADVEQDQSFVRQHSERGRNKKPHRIDLKSRYGPEAINELQVRVGDILMALILKVYRPLFGSISI